MIKITNKIDGKKYELVPRIGEVREPYSKKVICRYFEYFYSPLTKITQF